MNCTSDNHQHNCKQTLQRVILALDGELTRDDELQFISDLNICSHCLEKYHIEKEFKLFLTNKIEKKCCTSELKASIRTQLSRLQDGI